MRLRTAFGGVLCSTTALCSAAFGHDIAGALQRRHVEIQAHGLLRRATTATATPTSPSQKGDVFGVTAWPTVSIPAGYTLAGGVEITSMPVIAMSAVTGTAALSAAASAQTQIADPATWNQQVEAACQSAVDALNGNANNPSGMVACYNIAYLDTSQGKFEADLRIFNVSAGSGNFAGVPEADMMVTLSYASGQLSTNNTGNMQFPVRRTVSKRQSTSSGVWIPNEVMSQKYIVLLNNGSFTPGMNV
jgi:hypothetical protein